MFPATTKVLIVDDTAGMRALLKAQLEEIGLPQVVESVNGEDAFALIIQSLSSDHPIQLVLADWQMPVLSGLHLFRKIKIDKRTAHIPFLLVTADSDFQQIVLAAEDGIRYFLNKPFDAETLRSRLDIIWKALPTHNKKE